MDQDFHSHFKLVVGAVLLLFNPLSIKALSGLFRSCSTQSRISSTLRALHSLLRIPDNTEDPVQIFHKSFPDFLMNSGLCTDPRFFVDPPIHHKQILLSCLNVMKGGLKKNICSLDKNTPLSEVEDLPALKAACIGDTLGYACRFWTTHLARTDASSLDVEEVQKEINEFFTTHLLYWIEVLSVMGNLDIGIYALNDVEQWYMLVSCTWGAYSGILYSCSFRQVSPVIGQGTVSDCFWNTLTQSMTIPSKFTIIASHSVHLCLGFTSTTVQSSYKELG